MKNYLTLFLLCCVAIAASSYSFLTIPDKNTGKKPPVVHLKKPAVFTTATINLNNSSGTSLPVAGVYLKQGGIIVRTLYFTATSGVNSYSDIPAGIYEVQGFFSGSNPDRYRYGIPQKGPRCGWPEANFGSYTLAPSDVLSVVCILASETGSYPFCSGS